MFTVRNVLPILLVVLLSCGLSFGATKIVPTQFATIQDALNDANAFDVIEVQSNATFTGNLVFPPNVSNPNDVNYLTLQAGAGYTPTITVSGTVPGTKYIAIRSVGTTIKGFTINFSGDASTADNNSAIINATGGASTVLDCNIFGPSGAPNYSWIRGISGVAEISNVELSQCREGILCDASRIDNGFAYSITNSRIYNNWGWGVVFNNCDANVDNCLIETSGQTTGFGESANVITTSAQNSLLLDLRITNSTIRDIVGAPGSRNFRLQQRGTVTIEDCNIMGSDADEILIYTGTLKLNRCILDHNRRPGRPGGCVAVVKISEWQQGGIADINHCSLQGNDTSMDWVLWINDPNGNVTIKNSILTGTNGYHLAAALTTGYFISNYNDNDCNAARSVAAAGPAGPYDLRTDPMYIQTADSNVDSYFALQPYSPVIGKGEFGSNMGVKGPVTGYEDFPGDFDKDKHVDKDDLKFFRADWIKDANIVPAGPNSLLEDFESKTAIPDDNCLFTNWAGWVYPMPDDANYAYMGTSTLSMLSGDAYDGSQAMRWVYDVNRFNVGGFAEILVILPQTIDINVYGTYGTTGQPSCVYNQLKVMVRRDASNSPNLETFMYVKFFDKTKYTPQDGHTKEDLVAYIVSGATEPANTADAGKWVPWTIPLTRNNNTTSNLTLATPLMSRLRNVSAIAFGVRDQLNGPWGIGTGTIDMDKIELIDQVGCKGYAAADLNRDCTVNFDDFVIFANYWMFGKP